MLHHPLTNFGIQKLYQNESKFNGVYWRYNLSKLKDGAYVISLDEYKLIETHLIALYVKYDNGRTLSIQSFLTARVEEIWKEIKKLIGNKNTMTNIYRMQP